jgi:DNA polymerase I-like protein with 3'-5' exonuclease and polymerase domains
MPATAKKPLPQIFRGAPHDVALMGDKARAEFSLSTTDTIVEVVGDNALVLEAVEYMRSRKVGSFDLETTGFDPFLDEIVLAQVGDEKCQYLIWWQTIDPAPLLELLADEEVCKVGVNLKFDLRFILAKYGILTPIENVADAQLIDQVLHCGLTGSVGQTLRMTGMEALAARWLGLKLPKDEELRTGWGRMEPGNWTHYSDGEEIPQGDAKRYYAADDVTVPMQVIRCQKPWIKHLGLGKTVRLEHAFLPVLAEVEVRGLTRDRDKWNALAREAEEKAVKAQRELDRIFEVTTTILEDEDGNVEYFRDKNYGSSDQLRDLIREWMAKHYGVDVILSNKHFRESLEKTGHIATGRLDKLFEKKLVPNPDKPGSNTQVAYPNMTDLVEKLWDTYKAFLPEGAFHVLETDSKTFKFYRILHETPDHEIDRHMPTTVGLPPELVNPILDSRDAATKLERYAWTWDDLVNPVTGKIHTSFTQAATDTGRMSSSPNFQNIPGDHRYRECFIAGKGNVFVGADYAQIEPRIIAEISGDPVYMRTFWSGHPLTPGYEFWCGDTVEEKLDLYVEVGKQVGLIPEHFTVVDCKGDEEKGIEAILEGVEGRKQSKIVVLGLGYGTGKDKFHVMLILDSKQYHSKDYSDRLYDAFFQAVELVKRTLDNLSDLADPKKSKRKLWHPLVGDYVTYAETLGGRKRFFRDTAKGIWTQSRNQPIQGTGGEIMKHAAVLLHRWRTAEGIEGGIVNMIHDEFMFEVREDQAALVREHMTRIMSKVGQSYCPHVPIDTDAYIEKFWVKG